VLRDADGDGVPDGHACPLVIAMTPIRPYCTPGHVEVRGKHKDDACDGNGAEAELPQTPSHVAVVSLL